MVRVRVKVKGRVTGYHGASLGVGVKVKGMVTGYHEASLAVVATWLHRVDLIHRPCVEKPASVCTETNKQN